MKVNIQRNILQQFAEQLGVAPSGNLLQVQAAIGAGSMRLTAFPEGMEVYDFRFQLNHPLEFHSLNPPDSEWRLLNINLSRIPLEKTVNDEQISFQKFLPSGILFYPPDTRVKNLNPPHAPFHIVLIRFKQALLTRYFEAAQASLTETAPNVIYEDLESQMERLLHQAIDQQYNLLKRHAAILEFLGLFWDKMQKRQLEKEHEQLHPDDLKGLFVAAAHLRNPLAPQLPSGKELAALAGMGTTKFKRTFKQVFGLPPMQYHQQIKMAYAREAILSKTKTISEVSYEIGYAHPSKFTLAYKKQFGVLPSEQ
ncbi:MAG: AraC family transcriptional regulator [Bacteroidota bacterium]